LNVGILVPNIGNFGKNDYYSRQEIGLGRALARVGENVHVINMDPDPASTYDCRAVAPGVVESRVKCIAIGSHAIFSPKFLDAYNFERLIMFSDIQVSVPAVARWARHKNIEFMPYIGTVRSNKRNRGYLSTWSIGRNLKVYKAVTCLAKTQSVVEDLSALGVKRVKLMPVGFDGENLRQMMQVDKSLARKELNLEERAVVIAFVGQLTEYKNPLAFVDAFAEVCKDVPAQAVVVGDGKLLTQFTERVASLGLSSRVKHIPSLLNSEMWKVYRSADLLINTNTNEIYGMCILEAMCLGCPVVAFEAPGPLQIITDNIDGRLVHGKDPIKLGRAALEALPLRNIFSERAIRRISDSLTWDATCRVLYDPPASANGSGEN